MNQLKLTDRQASILGFAVQQLALASIPGWLTTSDIVQELHLDVDPSRVSRDWSALELSGLFESEGSTKSRRYRLRTDSLEYLEWDLTRPPELRRPVPYNFDFLRDYVPNVTQWLPDDALQQLQTGEFYSPADVNAEDYRRILNALIIDLSFASSVLENVNISWLDTKTLIEFGERPKGLTDHEMRIVLNHKNAIEFMRDNRGQLFVSRRDVFDIHKLVSAGLLGNPEDSGRIRKSPVFFDTSRYRPIDNSFVLGEQFDIFCGKAGEIENPHEQALFAMAFIPYLQPFQDGNKRTSRLAMNIPLINASLPPLSFTSMNKRDYMFSLLALYERGRVDLLANAYVRAYKNSAEKYGEIMRFLGDGGTLTTLETPRG